VIWRVLFTLRMRVRMSRMFGIDLRLVGLKAASLRE
jgi:hypothetical protein